MTTREERNSVDDICIPENWNHASLGSEDTEVVKFSRSVDIEEFNFSFDDSVYEEHDTLYVTLLVGKNSHYDYFVEMFDSDVEKGTLSPIYQREHLTAAEAVKRAELLMKLYDKSRQKVLGKNLEEFTEEIQRMVKGFQAKSNIELVTTHLDNKNLVAVFDGRLGRSDFRQLRANYRLKEIQPVNKEGVACVQITFYP